MVTVAWQVKGQLPSPLHAVIWQLWELVVLSSSTFSTRCPDHMSFIISHACLLAGPAHSRTSAIVSVSRATQEVVKVKQQGLLGEGLEGRSLIFVYSVVNFD